MLIPDIEVEKTGFFCLVARGMNLGDLRSRESLAQPATKILEPGTPVSVLLKGMCSATREDFSHRVVGGSGAVN